MEFEKLATKKLRISAHQAMEIADKLYNQGYISYPRTETNSFPKTMNLKDLVGNIKIITTPKPKTINVITMHGVITHLVSWITEGSITLGRVLRMIRLILPSTQ